jgi:acetolactate synthase-1/2/3 large subunit
VPDFSEALAALRRAERPVVVVTGDFDASGLGMIAARDRVPICVTASARGTLPDDHRWALTLDDQRTSVSALNEFLAHVDCCLVLGGQLSHVATAGYTIKLPDQHMIWVRQAAGGGEGHFPKARKITAEPRDLVEAWRREGAVLASQWTEDQMRDWNARLKRERRMTLPEPRVHGVRGNAPEGFFEEFGKAVPREAIVITDSGLHQVLTRRHLEVSEPRGLLFPSDFQSMGFGIPAAIGARLAAVTRPVVALVGDGGFLMTGFEMLTAVKESVPLVVIVFNDGQLNLIRLQQIREYGREHGVAVPPMDYEGFARAAGILYRLVDGDPALALRDALAANAPALVELRLGDSPAVIRARATSLVRETARGMLGRFVVKWLKRRFR